MIIDYSKIKKVANIHYQIIDEENIKVLKSFEKIYNAATNKKLKFMVAGSIGLMLVNKAIYRNMRDIDLVIKFKELDRWLEIMRDGYIVDSKNPLKDPDEDWRQFITQERQRFSFKDLEFGNNIELITNMDIEKNSTTIEINGNKIGICNPYATFDAKKEFLRRKDYDDMEFYRDCIKNRI